jgi:undecaprenyl-diphosphatase
MSVIISILQSIFQSIAWILPISESAHSSVYHTFAGRADGTWAGVTGAVHIGIAIGIFAAMVSFFIRLGKEAVGTVRDLAQRRLEAESIKGSRLFMLTTVISFAFMALWIIPLGSNGFLFSLLKKTAYNGTLIDDAVFMAITGGLIYIASWQTDNGRGGNKNLSLVFAIIIGVASLVLVPVSGFSFIGGVWAILILLGVNKKLAYRYAFVMSVPVLLVMGIVEIATAEYDSSIVEIILAIIIASICSFLLTRVFKNLVNKGFMKYIATYDLGFAAITLIIGVVQLITK